MQVEPNPVREELDFARAEEAEALRRANHLKATGSYAELQAALREVDACRARVMRLQFELKSQRAHVPAEIV
jgi:hypothetical protein